MMKPEKGKEKELGLEQPEWEIIKPDEGEFNN